MPEIRPDRHAEGMIPEIRQRVQLSHPTHRTAGTPTSSKDRLQPEQQFPSKPTALDFFAGSGLASEGLKSYFSVIWANDICKKKALTYRANHPYTSLDVCNIEEIDGKDIPPAILAWASFPCQDLSLAGNLRGIDSKRSGMVWEWLRVMDRMSVRPKIVVGENVTGLISSSNGKNYSALHTALAERGYKVGTLVLDAAQWVPQSRIRVFVIGVVTDKIPKNLVSSGPSWCHNKTLRRVASQQPDFVWWRLPEPLTVPPSLDEVVDLSEPTHEISISERNLAMLSPLHRLKLQASIESKQTVFAGYKRTRHGRQVLELRFDNRAGCLRTPQGGSSRQYLVVYRNKQYSTRLISICEAARLMGVPEEYQIIGSYNDGYKAMGDGVVVPAVRHLARYLLLPLTQA